MSTTAFRRAAAACVVGTLAAVPAFAEENAGQPLPPIERQYYADGDGLQFYGITVNADGSLDAPRGRVGRLVVSAVAGLDGAYRVTVRRRPDLHRRCHYNATIVSRDAFVTPAGVAVINATAGTNNGLYITTTTLEGERQDMPFALTIVCNSR